MEEKGSLMKPKLQIDGICANGAHLYTSNIPRLDLPPALDSLNMKNLNFVTASDDGGKEYQAVKIKN